MAVTFTCEACRTRFTVKPSRAARGMVRFCSRECRNGHVTRRIRGDGYVQLTGNGVNVLEHRFVMEQHLGRSLGPDEHVHHLNEVKHDNRLVNLELTSRAAHIAEHHAPMRVPHKWVIVKCTECGRDFDRRVGELDAHPECFCSRDCYRRDRARRSQRTCAGCGGTFHRSTGKFCGPECYHRSRRKS